MCEQHGSHPFERSERSRLIPGGKIGADGAVQQILCCDAAMQLSHVGGHNPLKIPTDLRMFGEIAAKT
ncbi:MAG: hypothetical protein AB7V13_21170, partial [Pseudorhodoplanes sp.]